MEIRDFTPKAGGSAEYDFIVAKGANLSYGDSFEHEGATYTVCSVPASCNTTSEEGVEEVLTTFRAAQDY